MKRLLLSLPVLLVLGLAALALFPSDSPAAARADRRVVVLGFDGADSATIERMMDAGELPNLSALRDEGTFGGLLSTAPPESPVAWAALNTGQNPAKTNVLGFVKNTTMDVNARTGKTGHVGAAMGHLTRESRPIAEFENTPVPNWSAGALAGAAFGVVFVVFFVIFGLLLKMAKGPAAVLSIVLAAAGGWGGYTVRGYLPAAIPIWGNPTEGRNFWDFAGDAGVKSIVIDSAMTFDMETSDQAKVLSGFGLPDARSGLGEWCIYTTNDLEFDYPPKGNTKGLTAGAIYRVDAGGADEGGGGEADIVTELYGPKNFWKDERINAELVTLRERLDDPKLGYKESFDLQQEKRELEDQLGARVAVDLVVERDLEAGTAEVRIGQQSQTLSEGQWSDWYHVTFDLNPLLKSHAVTRVKLLHLDDPHFELLVNSLDIDPAKPAFWQPISSPHDFSADLAHACGPYETYGWPSLTMPFKDEKIDPQTMLEDLEFTMKWREGLVHYAFDELDWDLLFGVFSITDRVQHMCYQYYDEGHPLYDEARASEKAQFFGEIELRDAVPHVYRQMDRIVGEVRAKMADDDVLLLCSDHGFQSARYQVHINNWLAENGYLVLKKDLADTKKSSSPNVYADWTETRAYALGLGFIYLNLKGREMDGIVDPAEADALMQEIREKWLATVDAETGANVCEDVYFSKEIHSGPHLPKEADMLVGFAPNYRVSWRTTQGGIKLAEADDGAIVAGPIYEDNTSMWSGGHVSVNLDKVRGAFFCTEKLQEPGGHGYDVLHVAPTILRFLGIEKPDQMDVGALESL